uniref:NADH dehydrogenase subunit 4L n=1 Tax=Heterobothrium okamotoi TaxID=263722 RepID=A0A7U0M8M4_9PLAT|nr:NADH dehydrogenase subunit 4L [Heterobothrium okamotoi]QQX28224.1 NADH dehydrogenase subunit 4L [Heterobothrium okamotoi]
MNSVVLVFFFLVVVSFLFILGNFLSVLMVLENMNIIALLAFFLSHSSGVGYSVFLVILVIMTLEVSVGLALACCLWNVNSLDDMFLL